MQILVTGATGVLGRPVVARLISAGHQVRGLARPGQNAALLDQLGATPIDADLFDRVALEQAAQGCNAILHLATKIPPLKEASRPAAWSQNDRIRAEGTRLLVDAALAAGVSTFVYPGTCFVYPDRGECWIDAADTSIEPVGPLGSTVAAEAEVARFSASGGRGMVLRMGAFYSPTDANSRAILDMARWGISIFSGRRDAYFSSIWIADAASAVAATLEGIPAGVYDIVDDQPLTRGELIHAIAQAVGKRWLLVPPVSFVRILAGKEALFATRSQRVSNRRFKDATTWSPSVPDAQTGWALIADQCARIKP